MERSTLKLVEFLVFNCPTRDRYLRACAECYLSAGADPFLEVTLMERIQISPLEALRQLVRHLDGSAQYYPGWLKDWPLSDPKVRNTPILNKFDDIFNVLILFLRVQPNNLNTMKRVLSMLMKDSESGQSNSFEKPIEWLKWDNYSVQKLVACARTTTQEDTNEQNTRSISSVVDHTTFWLLEELKSASHYRNDISSSASGAQQLVVAFK